jgi:UDP-N-acetylmuramate dehydrogenase
MRRDEPMARHLSWRAGGKADRCYVPADLDDLAAFLARTPREEPLLFVGLGSNLLVRDGGFRGTAVLMHAAKKRPSLVKSEAPGGTGGLHPPVLGGTGGLHPPVLIYAEAGVASPKVARFAATHGLGGAEFLAGVPGTVGGALAMNAGCYGGETWAVVERVLTMDRGGALRERTARDFDIGYRRCVLRGARLGDDAWFAAAWFGFARADGALARERIRELLEKRIASQPLSLPNAGSVFRNPAGDHAARLIEACGLKGLAHGGARISEKHANFIVNPGRDARAADIEWLIEHARETVRARTGIDLHPEVRIVGEPA